MKTFENKVKIIIWILVILLLVTNVNALIIGGRGGGFFNGTIDEVRIYNRALHRKEAMQHYYSNLYKYDVDKWGFYTNQSNLTRGIYTYYGCAEDRGYLVNCTETRILIKCSDADSDGICDYEDYCVGENDANLPADTACRQYPGFNYSTGCWIVINASDGTFCGNTVGYSCNETQWSDVRRQTNESQCDGSGTCVPDRVVGAWEMDEDCDETAYYYCYVEGSSHGCRCDDTDGDDVCDLAEPPGCVGNNSGNVPEDEYCTDWDFNYSSGCHNWTYIAEGTDVGIVDCTHLPEWTDSCYNFTDLNITCLANGAFINGSCVFDDICLDEPDRSIEACALYADKTLSEVICGSIGDTKCWSPHVTSPKTPSNEIGCCGDDGLSECWVNSTNRFGCCWNNVFGDVVYMNEPDDSGAFCNELGIELGFGNQGQCDNTGEQYCFASDVGAFSQDPDCCCCGDDSGETWSLFESGEMLEDVIVGGKCEDGSWLDRSSVTSTLYDVWTNKVQVD